MDGASGKVFNTLVFGNSHSIDGYNIWRTAFGDIPNHRIIWFGSTNKCREFREEKEKKRGDSKLCFERFSAVSSKSFLEQLDVVVFNSKEPFSRKKDPDYRLFRKMREVNPDIRFIILSDYITSSQDCSYIYNRYQDFSMCAHPDFAVRETDAATLSEYSTRLQSAIRELDPYYIDKWSLLCKNEHSTSCKTHVGDIPFTYDKHHLSVEFAEYVGSLIRRNHSEAMRARKLLPPLP